MQPLFDKVVIAERQEEATTETGIILTGKDSTSVKLGVVLFVGPDVQCVQPGQVVVPDWTKARPINAGGIQGAVLAEEGIFAIVG